MDKLLAEYVRTGSAKAFRGLVETHVDAVYSQCLRRLGDPAWADDVTQTVFVTLSQKAGRIGARVVLEGWLFTATRYSCACARRTAARRRSVEKRAALMRHEAIESSKSDEVLDGRAEEMLDDAIAHLGDRDRNAVLLRFFQQRSLREVGEAMGVSEDAAKQRVFRAVEKLRSYFGARGLTAPSATVAAWLGSAVKPAGIHVAQAAMARCAVGGSIHAAGMFSRWMWTWPKIAAGFGIAGVMSVAVVASVRGTTAQSPEPMKSLAVNPILADAAPTTEPFDQTTPLNALNKLCADIQDDDRVGIDECLCDDGIDPPSAGLALAVVEGEGSMSRLEKAWRKKFRVPMFVPEFTFNTLGGCRFGTLLNRLLELADAPEVRIDGDMAQVRVALPAEMFSGTGVDRVAAQGRWSGAMLVMRRVNGNWKMDTDRTFNIVANINRRVGNKADTMLVMQKAGEAINQMLEDVAARIETGSITSRQQAISTMQMGTRKAFLDQQSDGGDLVVLPVIGG